MYPRGGEVSGARFARPQSGSSTPAVPSQYTILTGTSTFVGQGGPATPVPSSPAIPNQPAPKDDELTLDEYGQAKCCNECRTMLGIRPDLTLFFSKCCGLVWCKECIEGMVRRLKSQKVKCPGCSAILSHRITDWSKDHLERQQFTQEVNLRKSYASTFNQTRQDFDTDEEYNDYLEMVQDIFFDLVHGTPEENKKALVRIGEYRERKALQMRMRGLASNEQQILHFEADQPSSNSRVAMGPGVGFGGKLPQRRDPSTSTMSTSTSTSTPTPTPMDKTTQPDRLKSAGGYVDYMELYGANQLLTGLFVL